MIERNPRVVVTSEETLPSIVERLSEAAHGGHTVDLVVPIDSALLLTAREFRILKDAIDEDRIPLILCTSDPLRLQLAERLGIPAKALPRPRVAVDPMPTVAVPIAPVPSLPVSEPLIVNGRDRPGETALGEPVLRPAPESHWPDTNGAAHGGDDNQAESAIKVEPGSENPPRRWLPVAAVLVLLVAASVVAIRFLVPQAVVTIVPRSAPVAATIMFDVTMDGRTINDDAAFAMMPQQRQIEVVWEGAVPVTGVRVEPDGTASAPIELRNASPEALVVEAGTTISTETGIEFAFSEAVTVPGADPTTGRPGEAQGNVRAVAPGSGGNVGTGELGGRLPNGVYYSNRMQPASGGSDKEFPVVAQQDIDNLSQAAKDAAPELAAEAIVAEQSGEILLTTKATITEQIDEFDHQVGEDATEVSVQSTLIVDVLTYDAAAASKEYTSILATRLSDEAPDGFAVDPDKIVFASPKEIQSNERGVRLEVAAEADAVAILDERERTALIAELAGADPERVETILGESPDIADYSVEYQPAWLTAKMPNNAARIEIEVAE